MRLEASGRFAKKLNVFLNFRIEFYLFKPNVDLPRQFGGFQTLSYDFKCRFGVENTQKYALEPIF